MAGLTKTIQFRASEEERAHLSQGAADAGMKLSPYLRSLVLSRTAVVVGEGCGVVVIPATDSPTAQDRRIMAAVQTAIAELNQAPSPPAGDVIAAVTPAGPAPVAPGTEDGGETSAAGTPAPVQPDVVAADRPGTPAPPSSVPATSPGEGGSMAGAGAPQEPPVPAQAAGAIPGPEETLTGAAALEPGGATACPSCGGANGRHQSFCEEVTGEPPVTGTETDTPTPEGAAIESREQFVARRISEGENQLIAEAEWRQLTSGQAPATGMVACPNCGTTKAAAVPCPDCGAPPPVTP